MVTIFTSPAPVQDSAVDVSVVVEKRDSSEAILDATVDLLFRPPALSVVGLSGQMCGLPRTVLLGQASKDGITQLSVPATRQRASNKLLYAAPIQFDRAGQWTLDAIVKYGKDSAKISCSIPVGPAPRRLMGLLPYLILPPVMVALFAVNQWLVQTSGRKKDHCQTGPRIALQFNHLVNQRLRLP